MDKEAKTLKRGGHVGLRYGYLKSGAVTSLRTMTHKVESIFEYTFQTLNNLATKQNILRKYFA